MGKRSSSLLQCTKKRDYVKRIYLCVMNNEELVSTRSAFLSVLCVLTFIGSGFTLFNHSTRLMKPGKDEAVKEQQLEQAMEQFEQLTENDEVSAEVQEFAEKIFENIASVKPSMERNMSWMMLLSALLTLSGAIGMWSLRQWGFWLYVLGSAIFTFTPTSIYPDPLGSITTVIFGMVASLFTILYAVNYRKLY